MFKILNDNDNDPLSLFILWFIDYKQTLMLETIWQIFLLNHVLNIVCFFAFNFNNNNNNSIQHQMIDDCSSLFDKKKH